MVGLARPVKIEWLNRTVELLLDGKSVDEIKADLNEYLSFEIDSPTSLRKTRESLINTCIVDSQESADVRAAALEEYKTGKASKLALHWCMLSLSYPIFADIATLIGKISHIQDEFTTAWVKEKLYESWGERTTLDVPVRISCAHSLILALCKEKTGVYRIQQVPILDEDSIKIIVMTILTQSKKRITKYQRLHLHRKCFRYIDVTHEWIYNAGCFTLTNFVGKLF
jgi:hypothetical protein